MKQLFPLFCVLCLLGCGSKEPPKPETLLNDLTNPSGIAIQPQTGDLFISTQKAVLRVRLQEGTPTLSKEIIDFPQDEFGKGPTYTFGPLGLLFWREGELVVGGGGLPDGQDLIRVYQVGETPLSANEVLHAEKMFTSAGPVERSELSKRGEGNYFGLARGGDYLYVGSHGDDTKGWISRVSFLHDPPIIEPWIAGKNAVQVDGPAGMMVTDEQELLVCYLGELHQFPDGLLAWYDPQEKALLRKSSLNLYDISDIAVSPTTGSCYVLDYAWAKPEAGGIFRVDGLNDDSPSIERIATLEHPTAMEFANNGDLYILSIAQPADGQQVPQGKLVLMQGL